MVSRIASYLLSCSLLTLSGCIALNGPLAYRYVPSLSTDPPLPFRVNIEQFRDERPEPVKQPVPSPSQRQRAVPPRPPGAGDRDAIRRIEPVDAQVTMDLLEDFRTSHFFEATEFADSRQPADLLMRGMIRRFTWSATPSPILFIPVFSLLAYLGIPTQYTSATVTLRVQLIDPRTDKVLTEHEKTETIKDSFSMYYRTSEAGAELAAALKSVSQQLKASIRADYVFEKFAPVTSHGP